MKEELANALARDFPHAFADLPYGFQCGDGWEPIIRRAAARYEKWILAQPANRRSEFHMVQVKQKLGGLRLYTSGHDPEVDELLRGSSSESYRTCEECGAPGLPRTLPFGGVQTLCDAHTSAREALEKDRAKR